MKRTLLFLIAMVAMVVLPACKDNTPKQEVSNKDTTKTEIGNQELNAANNENTDNMPFITLQVKSGAKIKMRFFVSENNTKVRIVSGKNTKEIVLDYDEEGSEEFEFISDGTTMTIYGDYYDFNCIENHSNITGIDISNHPKLQVLFCSENSISSLDLSKNKELVELACNKNKLTSLDLSNNEKLFRIYCSNNAIKTLDLRNIKELDVIVCSDNQLETLLIAAGEQLQEVDCRNNKLTTLDLSNNPSIGLLDCSNNRLTSLKLSKMAEMYVFNCKGNKLPREIMKLQTE